jgi:hypothetical protein
MPTIKNTPRMHFARRRSVPGKFSLVALIALIRGILVVFAMIALVALFGSADPSAAVAAAADGGMLILPP